MKQTRFQPLNKTYQLLSSLLCNTAISIQSIDYTAPKEWARLIAMVKKTCAVFNLHAEEEENTLFPILHNYEPALVAIIRDRQCSRMRYLSELCELFKTMQSANNRQKSKLFSHKLLYRIDEFVATTMQQMNEQEHMINAVLWRYYSDKELVTIGKILSIEPFITADKKDTGFADTIISNVIPVTSISSVRRNSRIDTAHKQNCAKALALAV